MSNDVPHQQRYMLRLLLIHLLLVIVIPPFFPLTGTAWDNLLVALVVAALLALLERRYARYLFWSMLFVIYLIKEIILSNIALAWLIVQPKPKLDPGIIAVPLAVTTPLEITVLSLAIAATPGTLVVQLGKDVEGHDALFIHVINVRDPDRVRKEIKEGFERMILQISQGVAA